MKNKIIDNSWDFRGEKTKMLTHGIHSYPAMMIPQIAERLLKENIDGKNIILDPFCGSGTVLVESMKINKKSYGLDINPLAILIARVKTTPIDPEKLLKLSRELILKCRFDKNRSYEKPNFQNIDFWFKDSAIKSLSVLKKNIEDFRNQKDVYNFFLVAFSETIRKSSNTRSGEFKLYRKPKEILEKHEPDVFGIFEEKIMKSINSMKIFYNEYKDNIKPVIIRADVRKEIPIKEKIDLIVTSPPYGDSRTTVAYGQFSRLSLQWLGIEKEDVIKNIDKLSLGGIQNKTSNPLGSATLEKILNEIQKKNKSRAIDVYSFNADLLQCLQNLTKVLANDGTMCFVVGNRTVAGIKIPTDDILSEFGQTLGLQHVKTIIRNIPSKRMPSENSPSNIKGETGKTMTREHIVILKKN